MAKTRATLRRSRSALVAVGTVAACWNPPDLREATTVLEVLPPDPVPIDAPVVVQFSRAVAAPRGAGGLSVVDADGVPLPVDVEANGAAWSLRPRPEWAPGLRLEIRPDPPLLDADGREVAWPNAPVAFVVVDAPAPSTPVVRWPNPGEAAATNVTRLVLEEVGPGSVVELVDPADRRTLTPVVASGERSLWAVPPGACEGLCPSRSYALWVDGSPSSSARLGRVRTGTTADARAPAWGLLEADVEPGRLEVRWSCDEPVWARFEVSTGVVAHDFGRAGAVRVALPPEPGAPVEVAARAVDLAGRSAEPRSLQLEAPPPLWVILREVVTTPQVDWGDSDPRGAPFDASPGRGTVSSADEWIELVNVGPEPVDVVRSGLRIRALDGTPAETMVAQAPALRFGDGGDLGAWRVGEALVVRPRGSMSQRDLVIEVWAGAQRLDRLELGDGPDAHHPGGPPPALERDALARVGEGRWRWCRGTPGDPRPNSDCGP